MLSGRKPRPSARRRLEGNPGHRPINPSEPQPPAPAPTFDAAPPELAEHPVAAAEWCRLAPMLRRVRQITDADRGALLAACIEWERYLDAIERVRIMGLCVKSPNGYEIPNPYLPIATKALANCNKLWPELGLTPSSRARVKAEGPPPGGDAFSEFDTPPDLAALVGRH